MFRPRRPNIADSAKEDRVPVSRQSLADYGRLLRYVRPYSRQMVLATIALVIGTLLGTVADGTVHVSRCFVVPHTESVDQVRPDGIGPCLSTCLQL